MNRKEVLEGLASSLKSYSQNDARETIEKVLKYSGDNFDIRTRSDIRREAVFIRYGNGDTGINVDAEKPTELTKQVTALVYVEQPDQHSVAETRRWRAFEIMDVITDWLTEVSGGSIHTDVWSVSMTGDTDVEEDDGYYASQVNFNCEIKLY